MQVGLPDRQREETSPPVPVVCFYVDLLFNQSKLFICQTERPVAIEIVNWAAFFPRKPSCR